MERNDKIIREAMAVYDPDDEWEQAIQNAAKHVTGDWLPAYPCRLLARAVMCLKCGDEWLNNVELMDTRAYYLFAPQMVSNKDELVFTTHLLYLRDILENQSISVSLHAPVTFVTKPLAHFLFRDCLVHIKMSNDVLRDRNPKKFLDVGGCTISENKDIDIDGAILGITHVGDTRGAKMLQNVINDIQDNMSIPLNKAASIEIAEDVFGVEEHYPLLYPGNKIWDKLQREAAEIIEVEPSETGFVRFKYDSGYESAITKDDFNKQFTVTQHAIQS